MAEGCEQFAEADTTAAPANEIEQLRAENTALREELDDVKASFAETLDDNENMGRVIDADYRLKAAMDEVTRLRAVADNSERTLRAKSGECAEAILTAKYWKNRAEKLLQKAPEMRAFYASARFPEPRPFQKTARSSAPASSTATAARW